MIDKPFVFISHRHKDKELSKVLYDFIKERTLGQVDLFYSSQAGSGPTPGEKLNETLRENLARTNVFILIYTHNQEDWAYCMYECGLATDPKTPHTRVIVFQCAEDAPRSLDDMVRVDIHNQESVRSFVISLLTDPDFFPDFGKPLAEAFTKDSPEIESMAKELGEKLRDAAPKISSASDEWPSFDSLTVELSAEDVENISKDNLSDEKRIKLIKEKGIVKWTDTYCPKLFGMPNISEGTTLEELFKTWSKSNKGQSTEWTLELCRQIANAAAWQFPKIKWVTMSSSERNDQYVPGVHYVRKLPTQNCMQFDIYFFPVLKEV